MYTLFTMTKVPFHRLNHDLNDYVIVRKINPENFHSEALNCDKRRKDQLSTKIMIESGQSKQNDMDQCSFHGFHTFRRAPIVSMSRRAINCQWFLKS